MTVLFFVLVFFLFFFLIFLHHLFPPFIRLTSHRKNSSTRNTSDLHLKGASFESLSRNTKLSDTYPGFPQSVTETDRIACYIRPNALPSESFTVHIYYNQK